MCVCVCVCVLRCVKLCGGRGRDEKGVKKKKKKKKKKKVCVCGWRGRKREGTCEKTEKKMAAAVDHAMNADFHEGMEEDAMGHLAPLPLNILEVRKRACNMHQFVCSRLARRRTVVL